MRRIRKDDEVIVIAGKDKGRRGKVVRMIEGDRVIVAGINMVKRHTKPNPARGVAGGIVEREAALHLSNVLLFNPATNKGDRVGFRLLEDGRKVRYFKSNQEVVDA
ncbi:MAG: 50S ribosomal protein L24 [Candidatus Competibacter denitrificans]|jgi:large subunit ribosomal protein L24|uniref:Large ribosomal subunit protein uL24 n=1 Tax=Candidatus Competibacter denitrificans Run_A_D11 TaxID=1400863 RepID=W6M339_9GAMM|nr:50S ribosomal protein L24 [Candidatus Competibacter denitrificans]CDI01972.1 50S ribosomal subunit protein L24 [Candidatus Competibacter denitrificans Run_A_D11]HAS86371.1 50S ribosomal protein L24 [Candidatus Competibacteraceae bacterium]HRC70737.1 50S ribosomal protein L24 [Candidatus Competibacter denitrificans]